MKIVIKYFFSLEAFAATGAALAALALMFLFSLPAQASGNDAVCQVTYTTTSKGETARNTTVCTWGTGPVLLMQCTSDVYASATSPRANNQFPDAGTTDFKYIFATNQDPVPLFLNSNQQHITVLGISDGGTCTFGAYTRRF